MQTRWLAVLVSVLALAAARAEAQPTIAGPIRIGIVGPFSGRSAEAGERVASAVKMAIEEQNAAGGILGAKVEAVIGETRAFPRRALSWRSGSWTTRSCWA
jgi:branched-chain amino acid transport system substrate-binding protein